MFRFTQETSSGSQSQFLAKITGIDKHSGTIAVILAKHWLWLPDGGSCVNRNMLEQILLFLMCFNNPEIYIIECISWIIKYLILLMHGATMKK
jgi:hypothetical protein